MTTTMFATVVHNELPIPSTPTIDPDYPVFPITPQAPTKQRQPLPPGTHMISPATFTLTRRKLVFPIDNTDLATPLAPDTLPTQPVQAAPATISSPREPYKTLADEALQQLFRT